MPNDTPEMPERLEFTCKRCGELGTVGFQPRDINDLLCRDCFEETGGKTYDLSNLTKAPRRKHDTRVAFRISCAQCGKDDELDYVPKGVPMSEVLCKECMLAKKGEASRWALVEREKLREQNKRPTYDVPCTDCGAIESLPFKPQPDREYFCYMCYLTRQRIEEFGAPAERTPRQEAGKNVFIRRRKIAE